MQDLHMHSQYSGDIAPGEGASVDELCARAVERGFSTVAVTDHFDIDGIYEGYFPPLDFEGVRRDVFASNEKYAGKLTLLYGLELGQGPHMKAQAEETLARYDFEYVIGSVHAVRGIIDFASTAYDQMTDGQLRGLLDQYIEELFELIEWGHFSTLAHITYPYRYFRKHNRAYLLPQGREAELAMFDGVLRALIASDKPLEVNTSGLRQGMGCPLPDYDLLAYYFELGGRKLTIGSDAHFLRDVGASIPEVCEKLRGMGFTTLSTFEGGRETLLPL